MLYGNGMASGITSDTQFSTALFTNYRLIQVGSSSDFVSLNITQPSTGGTIAIGSSNKTFSTPVTALKNAYCPVYATTDTGYVFDAWSGANATFVNAGASTTYVIPSASTTITATMRMPIVSNISTSVTGADSTVDITVDGLQTQGVEGETVTFTATSETDAYSRVSYAVTDSLGNSIATKKVDGNTFSFTMPSTSVTISATYAKKYFFNVDWSVLHGTITCNHSWYLDSWTNQITVTPDPGYYCSDLKLVRTDTNEEVELDSQNQFSGIASDTLVTATFAENDSYNITKEITGNAGGTLGVSTDTAQAGSVVNFSYGAIGDNSYMNKLYIYPTGGSRNDRIDVQNGTFTMPDYDVTICAEFDTSWGIECSTFAQLEKEFEDESISNVLLTGDIDTSTTLYVRANGVKTFNMNKHSINISGPAFGAGDGDSLIVTGNGSITSNSRSEIFNPNGGSITIENGTFTNTSGGEVFWVSAAGSKLVVNDGTFINNGSYQVMHTQCYNSDNPATIEINGGVWVAENTGSDNYVWACPASDTTVATINGGTFYSTNGYAFNFGWPSAASSKKIGSGKALYGDGASTSITSDTQLSTNDILNYKFIQVGSSSNFCKANVNIDNTNASFIKEGAGLTSIYAMWQAPVPIFITANEGATLKNIQATNGDYKASGNAFSGAAVYPYEDVSDCAVWGSAKALYEIAGSTRYETAARVALEAYPDGSKGVIVATGESFPDALAATSLAGAYDYPIVLTKKASLDPYALAAIQELRERSYTNDFKIIVIGGQSAISTEVMEELSGYGNPARIAGINRYDTAYRIYKQNSGSWADTAIIATGKNYPDALSIAGIAASQYDPIFLTDGTTLTPDIQDAIQNGGFSRVIIVGGENAVSSSVEDWIKGNTSASVNRLASNNRYTTSYEIAKWAIDELGISNNVTIATGKNFPDALAGGVLIAKNNSVLLLADSGHTDALQIIKKYADDITTIYVLGGTNAVPQALRNEAKELAGF